MTSRTHAAVSGLPSLRELASGLMSGIERRRAEREAGARMREDLQRIAEVSPHLLGDIGFEVQDGGLCGGRLWRRGRVRVWTED